VSIPGPHPVESATVARLREQLAERDEIIVALQHVIRDLRHEVVNLSVGERLRNPPPTDDSVPETEGSGPPGDGIDYIYLAECAVTAYGDAARFYKLALEKLAHQREERNDP
jgi:hypothetical protein